MNKGLLLCVLMIVGCGVTVKNTRLFQFIYEVNIDSTDGKKLEVWMPVPRTNEVQTISELEINTGGLKYSIEDDIRHNNKYLYINHENGTTKLTKVIMTFNVHRQEHQNVNYTDVNPQKYLGSYSTVPVGGIFDKIVADNNLSGHNIRKIYDLVLEGMHYGKPKSMDNKFYQESWLNENEKYGIKQVSLDEVVRLYKKAEKAGDSYTFGNGNSIYACDIGVGNCTDYHSYFISLNRTLNVPTRFHMGFPISRDESGKVDGYHCWADYYIYGRGWYPVDISEADKVPDKKDYFFGTVDENRVEMMVGRDFILKGYESKTTNFFIYPLLEINNKESFSFTNNISYKNL